MKTLLIDNICTEVIGSLNETQINLLRRVLIKNLSTVSITNIQTENDTSSTKYLECYLNAKKLEGCSEGTINCYKTVNSKMINTINKPLQDITTEDLRAYLSKYPAAHNAGNVTLENVRRIISCFFKWLENEDYIIKSPARKISRIKSAQVIKEAFTDEEFERLSNACKTNREKAIIAFLGTTGVRASELVQLNRADIDIENRTCKVIGKGNKERYVYIDAKTKIHLLEYLNERKDTNDALFVSDKHPHNRLTTSGLSKTLKRIGKIAKIKHIHPHKFRRTVATKAIEKGMAIELVQSMLGHSKIDTTMRYALVNKENVKISHKKFLG